MKKKKKKYKKRTRKKNKIILKIAEKETREEIETTLSKKVDEPKKLYKEKKTPIAITGKT